MSSAFAVEAIVNDCLGELLPAQDFDAIDRLAVIDKLLIGMKLAGATVPLSRGSEPLQSAEALISVRNRLVHPRRDRHGAFIVHLTDSDEEAFGPKAAARFLRRSAELVAVLDAALPPPHLAGVAVLLSEDHPVLDALVTEIGDRIDTLIPEDAPVPTDPVAAAQQRRARRLGRRASGARSETQG